MDKIKWGMIGTGVISNKFVKGLSVVKNASLYAIASRSKERAEEFALQYGIPKAFGSYEEMAAQEEVQVVYIGTLNHVHAEQVRLFLEHGKAVLCEKPFTISLQDTKKLLHLAEEKQLFLMEAMWTKFLPVIRRVKEEIRKGTIGEVLYIRADFGSFTEIIKDHRLYRRDYGGGALFDIGVYPISLVHTLMEEYPKQIVAHGIIGETGVDEFNSIQMRFQGKEGRQDVFVDLNSAIREGLGSDAWIFGTKGKIFIPEFFHAQEAIFYDPFGEEREHIKISHLANGYEYEVMEVCQCVQNKEIQSSIHSFKDIEETAAIIEEIETQIRKKQTNDSKKVDFSYLEGQAKALIEGETDFVANLANLSALLWEELPDINWVGFYLKKGEGLVLGPFQGKPACIRIPIGKGVCGTAAKEKRTICVSDVHQFPGHIACDCASNSELVIPILEKGQVIGVLDIDSARKNRFLEAEKKGLERVVRILEENRKQGK